MTVAAIETTFKMAQITKVINGNMNFRYLAVAIGTDKSV